MISQEARRFYFMIAASVFVAGVCLVAGNAIHTIYDSTIWLGDEVETTAEYKELFNDSFSGNVVMTMADGMYTVRDMNGTERTFERKWIKYVDSEGGI